LVKAGVIQSPYLISFFFLAILTLMGYEMSLDVVKAAEFQRLQASEAALRESEARFRNLADTAPVMVWMSSTDMLCNFFNKPWLEFTGRTMEQELGNGWSEGVHIEDLQRCLETYVSSFKARRPFATEYRLRRADGEYRWVLDNGAPRYTPEGGFVGYVGSCIDITERRRAQEALRESEQNMNLAASAANLAVWTWDIPRDEIWSSGKGHALLGFSKSDKLNLDGFLNALHPEDRKTVHQAVAKALDGNGEYESEFRVAQPNGPARWIAARGRVEFNGGKPIRMRGVSLDISWRKEAELEAARQRNELAHLSRVMLLGELSGSLAHELTQPLTAILSNAQAAQRFLAQGAADPAELQEILKDIVEEDKRAGEVIARLRLLLKKGEVQIQPLDLNEVVTNVLRLAHSDLVHQNVAVHAELAPHLPAVNGDNVQLQQVLLNLVLNGCDSMVGIEGVERKMFVRTEVEADKHVRVSVTDQGKGIPPEKMERIFEPFFTTKTSGMGLGLAICRAIISAHGGRLWFTNNAERGATFQFALPANAEGAS
jgi:two-component system, LuxR family, sensor kinase FixL